MTANVEGVEELVATFQRAEIRIVVEAERALDKIAADVTATAQGFVPVDTGATKGSIHASKPAPLRREVGPTTEYAPWLEMGTATMAPHAFLGPALDRHTPEFVRTMEALGAEVLR